MDRPTWALVIGIVAVGVVSLGVAVVSRMAQPPPDLGTPEGVAAAYILAVQNQEPDQAWELLESPSAVTAIFPAGPARGDPVPQVTREAFRQQVFNAYRSENRRLRILGTSVTGDIAKVNLEMTFVESGPFGFGGGRNPQTRVFELKQTANGWRITVAPPLFDLV